MALTSRVDENRALRTCMLHTASWQNRSLDFNSPAFANACKKRQKVNIANYEFTSTCLFLRFSKGHFSMPCYMILAWDESKKITHGWTKKSALLKPSIWQKMAKTWFKLAWFKLVFWVKAISIQTCCRKVASYVICMLEVNLSSRRS